jgi:hypothetical protein
VRAFEDELGVSTSDAQAMVDAEDVLANSAPTNAAQHHGPHTERHTPCAPFTGGDLTGGLADDEVGCGDHGRDIDRIAEQHQGLQALQSSRVLRRSVS